MKIKYYKIIKGPNRKKYTVFVTGGRSPLVYIFNTTYFYDINNNECGPESISDSNELNDPNYWDFLIAKLPVAFMRNLLQYSGLFQ